MTLATTGAIAEISLCPPLYCAEQYDSDLGLYYLRARYYNPLTGRFLSRDPANGRLTEPATLHKYMYASGDPVNAIDPTGRQTAVLGSPAIDYGVIVIQVLQATAGVVATAIAIECEYQFLASETNAWVSLGLDGDGDAGTVTRSGPCSVKKKDCHKRYLEEKQYCHDNWFGIQPIYGMCRDRAYKRYRVCVGGGDPDSIGPLEPTQWPDAPDPDEPAPETNEDE